MLLDDYQNPPHKSKTSNNKIAVIVSLNFGGALTLEKEGTISNGAKRDKLSILPQ